MLKEIDASLMLILSRMQELSKSLPEYSIVRNMTGVGDALAPKYYIAAVGDVRRFHNSKTLVAYAGINPPPYESGQYKAANRKIKNKHLTFLSRFGLKIL